VLNLFLILCMYYVPGRRIQGFEHDSVEDARAAMELFKLVQSNWNKVDRDSNKSSLKRKRSQASLCQRFLKRTRMDSESLQYMSDDYWPDDIQVCWF